MGTCALSPSWFDDEPALESHTTCQPACDAGYTVSGAYSCLAEVFTNASCMPNPCETPAAPDNGAAGTCTLPLTSGEWNAGTYTSGSVCQPTCDAGYTVSGIASCFAGTTTFATCEADPCAAPAAPANGAVGTCTTPLLSGGSCQPTCDAGYTVSGTASCFAGTTTFATCEPSPCEGLQPPTNGAVGTCTTTLASGGACTPTCDAGFMKQGADDMTCLLGTVTPAICVATLSPTPYPTAVPTEAPTAYPTASPTTSPTPACVAGRFVVVNGLYNNDGRCDDCPPGKISTGTNEASCTQCDPGTRAVAPRVECTDCVKGQYHPSSHDACITCDTAGAHTPLVQKNTECLHCASGKFQDADDYTKCVDCTTGQWTVGVVSGNTECVAIPTSYPTAYPTAAPTKAPTTAPTASPTTAPTASPTKAPVNCAVSGWSDWNACSVTCGGGFQSWTRTVTTAPANGGTACGALSGTRECNTEDCPAPVNCATSGWSDWDTCSATCGTGFQIHTRTVTTEAANGGTACGALSGTQECNTEVCPN